MENILRLLIVEDDTKACTRFQNIIDEESEIDLMETTNNSKDAFALIRDILPDAVILDLELHAGGGNGIELLKEVSDTFLSLRPYFIVTTNNTSSVTYELARSLGADFIMYKHEDGYSEKKVIDLLKSLTTIILSNRRLGLSHDENPSLLFQKLNVRINTQFNLIGISPKYKGFNYLAEAIILVYYGDTQYLCNKIATNHNKAESSVERAMQNAINKAWNTTDVECLLKYYTAKIQSPKGMPTITEFVHYYANKLKNEY